MEHTTPVPRDVVKLMAAMFNVDPSLSGKQVSGRIGLSVSRLARLFKREMGVSIVEYRNRLRFERLFELLAVEKDRRPTLRQAARAAGFGSYAHFHRLFRARWNMGPRQGFRSGVAPVASRPEELETWLECGDERMAPRLHPTAVKVGNS